MASMRGTYEFNVHVQQAVALYAELETLSALAR